MSLEPIIEIFKGIAALAVLTVLILVVVKPKKLRAPGVKTPTHQGFVSDFFLVRHKSEGEYQVQLFGTAGLQAIRAKDTVLIGTRNYAIQEVYDGESLDVDPDGPAQVLPLGYRGAIVTTIDSAEYEMLKSQSHGQRDRYFKSPVEFPIHQTAVVAEPERQDSTSAS